MDPELPPDLDSAFEPFQSEDGNYVRLAYSIFPEYYDPLDDPSGEQKSSVFIERVDGRWFTGIEFADEHRDKGLSRLAIQGLCNYLGKLSHKYKLSMNTPIYIDTDASKGFWEYIGFIKNTDGTGPELVSTLGRMCAWARREAMPDMPLVRSMAEIPVPAEAAAEAAAAPTPRRSARTVIRPPSRLPRKRDTPYSRKGGNAKKIKTDRRKTKGGKSQRSKMTARKKLARKKQAHKTQRRKRH